MATDEEADRLRADFRQLASLPCPSGKQKHATKREARAQATSLRTNRSDPTKTNTYFCNMCGHWHAGRR
jgi:rubrerythrin